MIKAQGGDDAVVDDPSRLPQAQHVHQVAASRAGYLTSLDALLVGRTAVALGAGRDKKDDAVDLSAGIRLHKKPGDAVQAGEPVLDLHYNQAARLNAALAMVTKAIVIGDTPPPALPTMIGWLHDTGEQMFVALP